MTTYWPYGLELTDTKTPEEILRDAQDDWIKNSNGLVALVLQEAKSQSGNKLIIVHAKHVASNRSVTLFSVVHRPKMPYPASIQPKDDELPNVLKRSYFKPGWSDIIGTAQMVQGQTIENKWVADTPAEFREKLEDVFNLGAVKSEVLSLVSTSTGENKETHEQASQSEEDET